MRLLLSIACSVLILTGATLGPAPARAGEPPTLAAQSQGGGAPSQPSSSEEPCTKDGLIHAEVSPAITAQVKARIRIAEKGAQVRDIAKLVLPCGFHIDPRSGFSLVLTDGTEFRRYLENNAFGFMPPFGFIEQNQKSYQLQYKVISESSLRTDPCLNLLATHSPRLSTCGSFGAWSEFFGIAPQGSEMLLAHYVVQGDRLKENFKVAEIWATVQGISFFRSIDSPGGSITLILGDQGAIYRAFVDVLAG